MQQKHYMLMCLGPINIYEPNKDRESSLEQPKSSVDAFAPRLYLSLVGGLYRLQSYN